MLQSTSEAGRYELLRQIIKGQIPESIRQINSPWNALVKHCLVVDNEKRIGNTKDCFKLLEQRNTIQQESTPINETLNSIRKIAKAVTDIDGHVYKTITIGKQTWLLENLKTRHYNDGSLIPNVTEDDDWARLTTGAYCNFENNIGYVRTYGRLYNWYAVNTGKLAPKGWHVPTDAEWDTLFKYISYNSENIFRSLVEAGSTHWKNPDSKETNKYGYSALPGGFRYRGGTFDKIEEAGCWWSSTGHGILQAGYMRLEYHQASRYKIYKRCGYSVRCIKD